MFIWKGKGALWENALKYIAHENQTLKEHLEGVAELSRKNAEKIGCGDYGELLGLLHDRGKYSKSFQNYIKSAVEMLDPDKDDDFVDAAGLKGKIDHSTAGAQFIWTGLSDGTPVQQLLAQILSLCLVSHHSGLIDCLTTDDTHGTYDAFTKRITKSDEKTNYREVTQKAKDDNEIEARVNQILSKSDITKPMEAVLRNIFDLLPEKKQQSIIFQFQAGLFVRFLFSCLIDADRQDSADSENSQIEKLRQNGLYQPWSMLAKKLETKILGFGKPDTTVNKIRAKVSEECLQAAQKGKGVFTLTVPTGGGKTLASLRFAINHADKYKLNRIVYVIPFTSIIDQNAEVVREILETEKNEKGRIVLEHHSNVGAEKQTWKEKLLTENWDAPVVYTTMVQFLEALFGGGTRGARRMHQLANAVIVFDEIQTLPIRCVHLFCNAVNFLVHQCGSSAVLCTATQPLLGEVDSIKGALSISQKNEIVTDVQALFTGLKRVGVVDSRKVQGWTDDEVADLAIQELGQSGSCLIIVNMKRSARSLFRAIKEKTDAECFHLSTGMCPAHRKKILNIIRERIKPENNLPTICVSTQLIEAGVDVDFGSVIRYEAGLDSIAQAAGRCNRNGIRESGNVYIVNPAEENIDCLKDIAIGKDKTERVLADFDGDPEKYRNDRIGPALLEWYYQNYFFERKEEMAYPVSSKEAGKNTTLLTILSNNEATAQEFLRIHGEWPKLDLRHSFMTAGKLFRAIDAPTQSVIVQYGEEGKQLVANLCSAFEVEKQYPLLKKAQQYSVNLFSQEFDKLKKNEALFPVQAGTEIYYLDQKYYSEEFGISIEPINKEDFLYA
jgi:CRISPR-associated endonuclease/helicase Cas3